MNAPGFTRDQQIQKGDADFFVSALRGLDEEFAIPENAVKDIKALSINVEYLTLSADVFMLIRLNRTVEEIKQAISDGRFKVNPDVIADKLLETVRELIQAQKG